MKSTFIVFALVLFSTPVFAGDSYLNCEVIVDGRDMDIHESAYLDFEEPVTIDMESKFKNEKIEITWRPLGKDGGVVGGLFIVTTTNKSTKESEKRNWFEELDYGHYVKISVATLYDITEVVRCYIQD